MWGMAVSRCALELGATRTGEWPVLTGTKATPHDQLPLLANVCVWQRNRTDAPPTSSAAVKTTSLVMTGCSVCDTAQGLPPTPVKLTCRQVPHRWEP
jgi:hypothetical protein